MQLQGQQVLDRYIVGDVIGEGGASTVYTADDLHLGRTVALKFLRPELCAEPDFVARFEREARAVAHLDHPNIVPVYDYGEAADTWFLAMQYLPAGDLAAHLRASARLPLDDVLRIAAEVAEALGEAHWHGVVHGDLKPATILLTGDGHAKVTDFGIAHMLNGLAGTTSALVFGTAHYIAPEQANGGEITPATDVYSLGVVLYEVLAGRLPFDGDSYPQIAMQHVNSAPAPLARINRAVPGRVAAIVERALAKDPAARFAEGRAMSAALWNERRALPISSRGGGRVKTAESNPWLPPRAEVATPTLGSAAPVATRRPEPPVASQKPPEQHVAASAQRRDLPPILIPVAGPPAVSANVAESPGVPITVADPRPAPLSRRSSRRPIFALAALAALFAGLLFIGLLFGTRFGGGTSPAAEPEEEVAGAAAQGGPAAASEPGAEDNGAPAALAAPSEPAEQTRPESSTSAPDVARSAAAASAAGRVVIDDDAFSGGYSAPRNYRGRTARWIYGALSASGEMNASFTVSGNPRGGNVTIVGVDSENGPKTPMQVLVNDTIVYSGGNPLPKDPWTGPIAPWSEATFPIPPGVLHDGRNALTIRNRAQVDNFNSPPYIVIDEAVVTY